MVSAIIFVRIELMRHLKLTAVIGVVLLLLSGCGQRGPLYMPQDMPQENTEPTLVPITQNVLPASSSSLTLKGA
ncbi:hypothetical protein BAE46_03665 [Glaciecola punicea]|nr:hypothetical protein BAE46_03665 [Glaciecola punicea]